MNITQKTKKMADNSVSVIILNWNTKKMLEKYLPQVIENSNHPDVSVVVADNGSTDGSPAMVKKQFPEVELIQFDRNYGFAGGYNRALQQTTSTFTVLLNSDVVPDPGWLASLIDTMNSNNKIAACVPKIMNLNHPALFEYAGAAGGFIDKYGYPFCRGRIFDKVEEDRGQYDTPCNIFWGSGAALMVRTQQFNNSGGLDEDFFAHMEEIDWCWRMKNQGQIIKYVPQSRIFHLGGGTLDAMSPRKTFLNFRNNLYMLYRNLPDSSLQTIIFRRLVLDFVAAARFLAAGEWQNFKAVYKAHSTYFKNLSNLRAQRKRLKAGVTTEKHEEIYPGSLVIAYFLKKRKLFSDLQWL